ncbi:MAG TPA: HD domain-containing phosphohydrolase [Candidatus Acidoferrales bacterium]|nr:HD domain-containing phosphohydrolase [Candidatus Acidoferrales bacterium]
MDDFTGSLAPTVIVADLAHADIRKLRGLNTKTGIRVIALFPKAGALTCSALNARETGHFFALLSADVSADIFAYTIEAAFTNIEITEKDRREAAFSADRDREELNRIGIALSSTRDLDALLKMILSKMRQITRADAGSLYIIESSGSDNGLSGRRERWLRFKFIQNDSRKVTLADHLPLNEESMAGYTAVHGEVVALDNVYSMASNLPYRFNPHFDEETGYRTRSLLSVPMKNARGIVIGVMQLLNCKRNWTAKLLNTADVEHEVQPFPPRAIRLAESLASQAAVAYENSRLYHEVEILFEGFVQASVTAIEQRDPTTSGHSIRVATMSVAFADALNQVKSGPYAETRFTFEQIKELRYAALLHDFGKIVVREEVLVKAKKLYPAQLAILRQRFDCVHQELETQRVQKKLDNFMTGSDDAAAFALIDAEFRSRRAEVDEILQFLLSVNDGLALDEAAIQRLTTIARKTYRDPDGRNQPILSPGEIASLSIPHGSLNDEERQEIESHVVHSFNFLAQIPWTSDLKYTPWIVRAHHEKSNGTGYPYHLRGEEIPLQAKMMTICDIFDALYASDRPYKKAVSAERALDILNTSVRYQELDADLFTIFVEARIFEKATSALSLKLFE